MKKILLTSIALGGCLSAFGQGEVVFENTANSSVGVTLTTPFISDSANNFPTGPFVVELLWNNGSSYVLQATATSSLGLGQFNAGIVNVAAPLGKDTFEVEGFYTAGSSHYSGVTAPFSATVATGTPTSPAQGIDIGTGSFSGNLILTAPEPTTLALGGLGAAALLLFRRRK